MREDRDDPLWAVRPLLEAGFEPEHLRGLAEWIQFEAIAAEEEERPASLREIESHMTPQARSALREVISRLRGRSD